MNVGQTESEPEGRAAATLTEAHVRAWDLMMSWGSVIDRVDRDVREAGGINLNALLILRALVETPERRLTMNKLAARVGGTIGLSRSAVSRLTAQMEKEGLVIADESQEVRRGEDGRTRAILLSHPGATTYIEAWPAYARAITRHFARYLDEPAAGAVLTAVERVVTATGKETAGDGATQQTRKPQTRSASI